MPNWNVFSISTIQICDFFVNHLNMNIRLHFQLCWIFFSLFKKKLINSIELFKHRISSSKIIAALFFFSTLVILMVILLNKPIFFLLKFIFLNLIIFLYLVISFFIISIFFYLYNFLVHH